MTNDKELFEQVRRVADAVKDTVELNKFLESEKLDLSLKRALREVPVVSLSVPKGATYDIKQELYDWFKLVINPPFVLEINLSNAIVAGVELSYKGKFYSKTYNKALEDYFVSNKDYVSKSL